MVDVKDIECGNCNNSGIGQGGEPCDKCKSYMDDLSVVVSEQKIDLDSNVQVQGKVRVKRNRGLKADVLKQIAINRDVTPNVVFEALKSNSYGGSKPVLLSCVMSTMSQIKKKGQEVKVAESLGIEVVKCEPKEQ